MRINEVLSPEELDSLKMHDNYFGNANPEWLLDALLWKGYELDISDFALLCIANWLQELKINLDDIKDHM